MTTTKKMTKADYFRQIKSKYPLTDDENAFIDHELELLAKKNISSTTGEKKLTATQKDNERIKEIIYDFMAPTVSYTITDLIKQVPECADFPTSKVSALVTQLKNAGKVVRTEVKGRAYFTKA